MTAPVRLTRPQIAYLDFLAGRGPRNVNVTKRTTDGLLRLGLIECSEADQKRAWVLRKWRLTARGAAVTKSLCVGGEKP